MRLSVFQALLLVATLPSMARSASKTDTQLLLDLKSSFANGDQVLTEWVIGSDACSWRDIVCNKKTGRVTQINLGGAFLPEVLRGTVPLPESLPDTLEVLNLGDNALEGTISTNWTQLRRLQTLGLEGNRLRGALPTALPDSLKTLGLGRNLLVGDVPILPGKLQSLDLSSNDLSTIPSNWPSSLVSLDLSNCTLTGTIPRPLPDGLTGLVLYDNDLTGDLPPLPSNLTNLELQNNLLSGPLPEVLPIGLTILNLENNRLDGTIPSWTLPTGIPGLPFTIRLFNNSLTGSLPKLLGNEEAQIVVKPGNDGLCGTVPEIPIYLEATSDSDELLGSNLTDCAPPIPASSPLSTPPSISPTPNDSSSSLSSAGIAGVVIGAICCAVALCLLGFYWHRRRQHRQGVQSKAVDSKSTEDIPGMPDGEWKDLIREHDMESGRSPTEHSNDLLSGLPSFDSQGSAPYLIKHHNSEVSGGLVSEPSSVATHATPKPGGDVPVPRRLLESDPLLASIVSKLSSAGTGTSLSWSAVLDGATPARESSKTSWPSSRSMGMDMKMFTCSFQDIELEEQIGEGSFGKVYLGRWKETQVAVKLLVGSEAIRSNPTDAAELVLSAANPVLGGLQEEAETMVALRHPNVLSFLAICTVPPCMVSEFCSRGSLYDILRQARDSPALQAELTWERRLKMATDAAQGMLYLHSRSPALVHRDLKSPNLLVSQDWTVKVSDFNLSRFMEETGSTVVSSMPAITNPRWLAPEVLAGQKHTLASDMFSYGVVLWELLCWEVPYASVTNFWQVVGFVIDGGGLDIPDKAQLPGGGGQFGGLDEYIALIHRCWAKNPTERPSFTEVIAKLRELSTVAAEEARQPHPEGSTGSQPVFDINQWLRPIL